MKFSTRSRYGLRFLVYLGANQNGQYIQLKEVSEKEKISIKYLEQIVRLLKTSDLLEVLRGPKGGYRLAKDPKTISLKSIFILLEGNIDPIDCLSGANHCNEKNFCPTLEMWSEIKELLNSYLSNKFLQDLIDKYNKKREINMFYI